MRERPWRRTAGTDMGRATCLTSLPVGTAVVVGRMGTGPSTTPRFPSPVTPGPSLPETPCDSGRRRRDFGAAATAGDKLRVLADRPAPRPGGRPVHRDDRNVTCPGC